LKLEHAMKLMTDTLSSHNIPLPENIEKVFFSSQIQITASVGNGVINSSSTCGLAKLITNYTEKNTQDINCQTEYEEFCKRTLPSLSHQTITRGIKLKRANLSRPRAKLNSENRKNTSHRIEFRTSKEQRDYSNLRGRSSPCNNRLINRSPEYNRKAKSIVPTQPINNIQNNMDRLLQSGDLLNSIIVKYFYKYRMQTSKIKKILALMNPINSSPKITQE